MRSIEVPERLDKIRIRIHHDFTKGQKELFKRVHGEPGQSLDEVINNLPVKKLNLVETQVDNTINYNERQDNERNTLRQK